MEPSYKIEEINTVWTAAKKCKTTDAQSLRENLEIAAVVVQRVIYCW
jgi:hypothetical protein